MKRIIIKNYYFCDIHKLTLIGSNFKFMLTNQNNKERYSALCDENKSIPLFMQAWWMNAVCDPNSWDVLIYEKNNKISAVWVYHFRKKYGFKVVLQPQLTQTNGMWIDYPEKLTVSEKLSFEKELMTNLIQSFQKKKIALYDQNFHHTITNWLPFYWNKFKQTTRYTYQIKDLSNTEKCFNEFSYSKRKQIKKSEKLIKINFELSGSDFYDYLHKNLTELNQKVFYSKKTFLNLYEASKSNKQGCIISAVDEYNNLHAALFIVWDSQIAYNLISTITPRFRSSGASTLVVWEAIKAMSKKSKIFDFEGSMDKNTENSFQQFGAIQIPYFRIYKFNSLLIKIICHLKG